MFLWIPQKSWPEKGCICLCLEKISGCISKNGQTNAVLLLQKKWKVKLMRLTFFWEVVFPVIYWFWTCSFCFCWVWKYEATHTQTKTNTKRQKQNKRLMAHIDSQILLRASPTRQNCICIVSGRYTYPPWSIFNMSKTHLYHCR